MEKWHLDKTANGELGHKGFTAFLVLWAMGLTIIWVPVGED